MGVDTMEVPVDVGAEKPDTNVPLKPLERTAPSPLVKQITKAGWRAGNPEGAKRMIAELEGREEPTPPKLDLPQHEPASSGSSPSDNSEGLLPQDKIPGLQGKNEEPSLFKRLKNNAPLVAADRVGRIKEHIQNKAGGAESATTEHDKPAVDVHESAAEKTSEANGEQNGSENAQWNGFDLSQMPQSKLRDHLVSKNGAETTSVESKTAPAPDGFLQVQVDAFNASLESAKGNVSEGKNGTIDGESKVKDDFVKDLQKLRGDYIAATASDKEKGKVDDEVEIVGRLIGKVFMDEAFTDLGLVGRSMEDLTPAEKKAVLEKGYDLFSQESTKEIARDDFDNDYFAELTATRDGIADTLVAMRTGKGEQAVTAEKSVAEVDAEAGNAPEDVWEKQEKDFIESLKPVEKAEDAGDLSKETLDTWEKAKDTLDAHNAAVKKADDDAELAYKSGLFSTQATLDRFGRESKEMRGTRLDARDEVLDAVQKFPVKTGEPLDTAEQQRAWYEKVQGPAPDRPAPGTTTSYKSREATAATPPAHVGPEAAAMRAAEDKTATTYAKWKELANADRLAEQLQAKQARLRSLRRVVAAGLISTGVIMGIDVSPVLAPGVGSSPASSTESGTLPIESTSVVKPVQAPESPKPAEEVAKTAEPIVKAPEETPKPAEPIQMPEFDTTTDKESEKDGMAYILNIDHEGDSISGSWIEQKIPGLETVDEAKQELSNPVVVAALLSANPEVFIGNNTTTQEEIDALIARLANGDQSAVAEANEKILDHVKVGDKILTLDKAGFDELEQHLIEKVREASTTGQVDKATVWIKLHAELVRQKEAAMKSTEPVPYTVMTDGEVEAQKASTNTQMPQVTDVPNTGTGGKEQEVQETPGGIRYRIAKLFGGNR